MLNNTEISTFNHRDGTIIPIHYKDEVWKEITDLNIPNIRPTYAVSNYGRVANINTRIILKPSTINSGYLKVSLYRLDGSRIDCTIHRLVMSVFTNVPYTNDEVVNHKDTTKMHNLYTNLEWTSYSGNNQHAYDNNLRPVGEAHNFNKYPESMIRTICEGLEKRLDYKTIAESVNMSFEELRSLIGAIRRGKIWRHISCQYNIPKTRRNDQVFSDEQAEYICQMINAGIETNDILINLGYELSNMDSDSRSRLKETIRKIRKKERYTHISDKYF